MELPMFSKALGTRVIDGKVFVDLERLVELVFDISNATSQVATRNHDASLGVMTLGVAHVGKALEAALEAQKDAAGLTDRHKQCSRSEIHPAHNWFLKRKLHRCRGVDQPQ